jgi:hypothetical protein
MKKEEALRETTVEYNQSFTQEYLEFSKQFLENKKKLEELNKRIKRGDEEFLTINEVFDNLDYKLIS